jgi:hypothetical protein
MERRQEPRFVIDEAVTLTVLGERNTQYPGRVKNVAGRGIGMTAPAPIEAGAAVSIKFGDSIMLGEVVYCRSMGGPYFLGLEIQHAVGGLRRLADIFREWNIAGPSQEAPPVGGSTPRSEHEGDAVGV